MAYAILKTIPFKKIILALFISFTFFSCSNEDTSSSSNNSELIIGLWKLETINGESFYTLDIIPITEYEFKPNGDFTFYTGGNINEQGSWSINSDNTIVTIKGDPFNIKSLTNSSMKLVLPYSNPDLSIEYGFSKVK